MSDYYLTVYCQRGADEAFRIASDDARKMRECYAREVQRRAACEAEASKASAELALLRGEVIRLRHLLVDVGDIIAQTYETVPLALLERIAAIFPKSPPQEGQLSGRARGCRGLSSGKVLLDTGPAAGGESSRRRISTSVAGARIHVDQAAKPRQAEPAGLPHQAEVEYADPS